MGGNTMTDAALSMRKPRLPFLNILTMCFGFFGIQMGFALQTGHFSRVFSTLGAEVDLLPLLWIAGPVTGLIVQPIVGYFSDRTWGRLRSPPSLFLMGRDDHNARSVRNAKLVRTLDGGRDALDNR